jgi:serine/threonine protein kinase
MSSFSHITTEQEILENFYMGDKLGEGSFGTVRNCQNKITGEEIAVKLIDKAKLDCDEVNSLGLEIDIIGQVDHPNIVKTYALVDAPRKLYILMEKMTGGELFDRIVEYDHYSE